VKRRFETMAFAELPTVLKPEEVASYLRVRPEVVYAEITARRLNAIRIGNELRIRKEDLVTTSSVSERGETLAPGEFLVDEIEPAPAFEWKWPSEKARAKENRPERFPEAYQTRARLSDGRVLPVLIGVTERGAAGKPDRKRILVIVNSSPTAEFAGDDDSRLVAGVIKPDGYSHRHLRNGEPLPPAYASVDTRPYNEIVCGPHASHGIAVVCAADDYKTMVRHALIRWTVKKAARG
jgi:excisionase family DNA binding protein